MSREKIKAKIEAEMKQMRENRTALTETARAIHGAEYAEVLDGTSNIVLAIKAVSQNEPAQSQVHELLKSAVVCVLTCGLHQLFVKRGIEEVTPEGMKLAEAFQKDIVAITNHGYKRINIKPEDLEDEE